MIGSASFLSMQIRPASSANTQCVITSKSNTIHPVGAGDIDDKSNAMNIYFSFAETFVGCSPGRRTLINRSASCGASRIAPSNKRHWRESPC